MSDIDEESAFDFVAMVEESEKQMRSMYKHLPDQLCAAVEKALAGSGKIETLERASDSAARSANYLRDNGKKICRLALALTFAIPLVVTIYFFVQLRWLNSDKVVLEKQINGLAAMANELKKNNPDGLELVRYSDGNRGITLPRNAKYSRSGQISDGRDAIVFIQP